MSTTDRLTALGWWAGLMLHAAILLALPTVFALWVLDGLTARDALALPALVGLYGWTLYDAAVLHAGRWGA